MQRKEPTAVIQRLKKHKIIHEMKEHTGYSYNKLVGKVQNVSELSAILHEILDEGFFPTTGIITQCIKKSDYPRQSRWLDERDTLKGCWFCYKFSA